MRALATPRLNWKSAKGTGFTVGCLSCAHGGLTETADGFRVYPTFSLMIEIVLEKRCGKPSAFQDALVAERPDTVVSV